MKTNILIPLAKKCIRLSSIQKTVWIIMAVALFAFVNAHEVGNRNRKANQLYSKGKYEEALRLYDEALTIDPTDGKLRMNRGSALFRLNEFDEAEQSYLDALNAIPQNDIQTLADAHYNLGNIQFAQGEQLETTGGMASAREKFTQALENYINTLKLRPDDNDAKWNLQLAHQKIDMLENQENQQQQNQDDDGDSDQDQQGGEGGGDEQQDEQSDGDNQNNQEQNQDRQNQQQQREQEENDMRREEAERLINQFSDDAPELNRPQQQHRGRVRQPERDW
ncbi:MAG: tetratricopeptide repeat protein [Chitinispirillales bacterium]|jgi:tetratricopeptide (TPR) repeat protein|nr:tetratricopeptide repeat protein [Chitinispirillales bacterium]